MKTLRRRLFQSHLTVMFVAFAVLLVGVAAAVAVAAIISTGSVRAGSKNIGPLGIIVPLAAAAIAAGLVSWRVAHRLAAPIESIRAATHRIAAGDYNVVVDGGDTTELAELARDVNRMAHEIATTEDHRLRLIGDIGHELRNPLATIEGSLEALLDGVIEPDDQTIAGLARESARLRRLAGDLSELSAASEFSVGDDPVDI